MEKIVQHTLVTLAFYNNWNNINSTVAFNPNVLMILGGIVACLFIISLWGLVAGHQWATSLVLGLAIFDIIGEFIAQGTIIIAITVSFIVAIVLLIMVLVYRKQISRIPMDNGDLSDA